MPLQDYDRHTSWRVEDIDFDAVDRETVRKDEFLFLTLASASFVEILSETYSHNLVAHFRGDAALTSWLEHSWQREEVQHGRALKTYVKTVWPEFDWEGAHAAFCKEYSALCTVEKLEQHRALELVARCVVETGTSTFYRALLNYVREPVLRKVIDHIKTDEAAHYTNFRRYFASYNAVERHGTIAVMLTMWRRLREIRGEDAYIAFKHVYAARHPDQPFFEPEWRLYNAAVKRYAQHHYPYSMAAKMLVKPIPLFEPLRQPLQWILLGMTRLISVV